MVIDCRATSYSVEDTVFHCKANDMGDFRVGVKDVWDPKVDAKNLTIIDKQRKQAAAAVTGVPTVVKRKGKKALDAGVSITLRPADNVD
jgi:hypothetical protein